MNSRREMSENERALVIKRSKDGKSLREIASLIEKSHGATDSIKCGDKLGKNWILKANHIKTVKYGGRSVLVWGCMSAGGVGELVFIDGIMDKMQDNDPKHTAKIVKLYLMYHCKKERHIPPQSSDLNVNENLWSQLKKSLYEHAITSKEDLKNVLKEEWTKITVETTKKLV
ncbi:transposable element Tcb1 transposase [Trichonephila clavipes]|nr:transposable element Tcb1 transposase [Trichonephila clavipes]